MSLNRPNSAASDNTRETALVTASLTLSPSVDVAHVKAAIGSAVVITIVSPSDGDEYEIWDVAPNAGTQSITIDCGTVAVQNGYAQGGHNKIQITQDNAGIRLVYNRQYGFATTYMSPGTGTGSVASTFVFRPGGTAGANVYTSFSALVTAAAAVAGPRQIEFDSSLAAITIPAGAWDFGAYGDVTFVGAQVAGTAIAIADGATFVNPITRWVRVQATFAGTTVPCMAITIGTYRIDLYEGSQWTVSGSQPLLHVSFSIGGAANVALYLNHNSALVTGDAQIGGGHYDVVNVTRATLSINVHDEAAVQLDTVSETSATFVVTLDSSAAQVSQAQYNMPGHTLIPPFYALGTAATAEGYTAGTPGNWGATPPTRVSDALDALAAINEVTTQNAAPIAPGANVTVVTAALTKAKTGKVLVTGAISGTSAAVGADTINVVLARDGVTVLARMNVNSTIVGGSNLWNASFAMIDTLPDGAGHTYEILATSASSANVGVPAVLGASVSAVEIV